MKCTPDFTGWKKYEDGKICGGNVRLMRLSHVLPHLLNVINIMNFATGNYFAKQTKVL